MAKVTQLEEEKQLGSGVVYSQGPTPHFFHRLLTSIYSHGILCATRCIQVMQLYIMTASFCGKSCKSPVFIVDAQV